MGAVHEVRRATFARADSSLVLVSKIWVVNFYIIVVKFVTAFWSDYVAFMRLARTYCVSFYLSWKCYC